jgi:hypothetical protein
MKTEKDLLRLTNNLARARKLLAEQDEKVELLLDQLTKMQVYKDYLEAKKEQGALKDIEKESYERVKQAALDVFSATGAKQLLNGTVNVKEYVVVVYDKETAESWVRDRAPFMLKVDWKAFESTAKAGTGGIPNSVAKVDKEPRASVSKDLSAYEEIES